MRTGKQHVQISISTLYIAHPLCLYQLYQNQTLPSLSTGYREQSTDGALSRDDDLSHEDCDSYNVAKRNFRSVRYIFFSDSTHIKYRFPQQTSKMTDKSLF